MSKKFNKKEFINDVKANVRTLYRKNLDEATPASYTHLTLPTILLV